MISLIKLLFTFFFVLTFFTSFVFNNPVLAMEYGVGSFGAGEYNQGASVMAGPLGESLCTDSVPSGRNIWLYQANSLDKSSIILRFANFQSPVDHFAVEYGTASGNYQFAVENIGGKETNSYVVGSLNQNTTYYFRVRSGNGCATGEWSNELSAKTLGSFYLNNLEITDSTISSLESNGEESSQSGYEVNIKVVDTQAKPVKGAKVKLFSEPKEAITDEEGIAKFTDVEKGDHTVLISYRNYEGEEKINLDSPENVVEFNINVTIKPKNAFLSKEVLITALILIVVFSVILILKAKLKRRP